MTDSEILYEYCKTRFPNDPYEDLEYRRIMGKTTQFAFHLLYYRWKELVSSFIGNVLEWFAK